MSNFQNYYELEKKKRTIKKRNSRKKYRSKYIYKFLYIKKTKWR
jgi:hypothetical protein